MSKRTKLLRKENNELEKQIKAGDDQILTDMVVYIRSANISSYDQERVRRDLWQMLLDGERRGMTPGEVIGDDYKAFCDAVISEIPHLSYCQRFLLVLRDTLLSIVILMIIWFVFRIPAALMSKGGWPYFSVTLGNVISGILIIIAAFFIVASVSKAAFEENVLVGRRISILSFAIILVTVALNYLEYPLFQIHVAFIFFMMGILFLIYKILDYKID